MQETAVESFSVPQKRAKKGVKSKQYQRLSYVDVNHSLLLSDPYYKTIFVVIIHLA